MDRKKYKIEGIIFEIVINSDKYKLEELFNEPQPYNLYINYYILECNSNKINNRIIINDKKEMSIEILDDSLIINANISKLLKNNYNHQFSLFGNKGIIQKYILHVLETKYKRTVFHGCALKNNNNEIIIGLGGSGGGKSVLINMALQRGWELISTEQTIISDDMYIIKGNMYDNISPLSETIVKEKLPKAIVLENKRLIEPIGEKIFVDMTKYGTKEDKIKIDLEKLTIINVNFNGKCKDIIYIKDKDYLLRLMQISASEKIMFPSIIEKKLIDFPYVGDSELRQKIIDSLLNNKTKKIILSNGFEGFSHFFDKKGEELL